MIKIRIGKKNLTEEKIGDKFYLYHATNTNADMSILHSFRSGIRTDRNLTDMAKNQGGGFYLWQSKKSALNRLKSSMVVPDQGKYRTLSKEKDGYPLLVTVEAVDLNPMNFVADSEVSAISIVNCLGNHIEEINKILSSAGGKLVYNKDAPGKFGFPKGFVPSGTYSLVIPKDYIINSNGRRNFRLESLKDIEDDGYGQELATIFYDLFSFLQKKQENLYISIMKEILEDKTTDAVKYIGKEIIKPYKLEILDDNGNLIDVTNKDPWHSERSVV